MELLSNVMLRELSKPRMVGLNAYYASINNCYAIGEITEPHGETTGGLVGFAVNSDNVTNSFYDQETTGQSDSGKGEPKSTYAMMRKVTYTAVGWDFFNTWDIDDYYAYPFLIDVDNNPY
jgi:hypothetical protein